MTMTRLILLIFRYPNLISDVLLLSFINLLIVKRAMLYSLMYRLIIVYNTSL